MRRIYARGRMGQARIAPSWPDARQWMFSVKAFLAAMLALYIALALALPRPYWAMATVYFVSHPLTGATRSKAAYRVAGTVLGATAAVITVPLLVNAPLLLMGAIALWAGLLLYLSLLQRTPRSYVFLLAAYTLPLVALPAVSDPGAVFDIAIARIEEIVLGILCASLVGSVVFPVKVAPTLRARCATWLADAALWATDMLSADPEANAIRHDSRHRLATDIVALDALIAQLSYDAGSAQTVRHARALRERMTLLLPVLSSLASVVQALRRHARGIPEPLSHEMGALTGWMRAGCVGPAPALSPPARGLATRAAPVDARWCDGDAWHAVLVAAARLQLRRLADLCEACRALQQRLGRDDGIAEDRPKAGASGQDSAFQRGRHHDHGLLLFAACSTSLAVFCAGALWIVSGWDDGASAVGVASIACCFFATIEAPRPVALSFLRWSIVCLLVSSFYLFLVVPNAYDFETLVGMLAVPYLGIGLLTPRPGFNLIAMLLSVNTASFANFQGIYDANFLGAFNTSIAGICGMLFAPLWAMATRPFGSAMAAQRLIRASWKDLAQVPASRDPGVQAGLSGRMLDRLGQLVPRLASNANRLASDGFTEFQVGFSVLALQRSLAALPASAADAVTAVLEALAAHYRTRLENKGVAPPSSLARRIDEALMRPAWSGNATTASPASEADALAALAVLRVTLYPAGAEPARNGGQRDEKPRNEKME